MEREEEEPFFSQKQQQKSKWNEIKMCWEPLIFVTTAELKYSFVGARNFDFPDFLLTVPANDYLLRKFLYTYRN